MRQLLVRGAGHRLLAPTPRPSLPFPAATAAAEMVRPDMCRGRASRGRTLGRMTVSTSACMRQAVANSATLVTQHHQQHKRQQQDGALDTEHGSPFLNMHENPPIIIQSAVGIPTIESFHSGRTLSEQLAVMHACLATGDANRSRRMLVGLYKLYSEEMKRIMDISAHNAIIHGLLNMRPRPLTTESLEWYEKMQKEYGVRPDANTFAVLIKGFLRINSRNVAKVLINEMTRKNIEPNQIFMSKYIGDPDIAEINQLFGEVFGSTSQLKGKDFSEKYLVSDVQDKAAHENSGAIVNPSSSASKGDAAGLPEVRSTGVLGIRLLKKMLNPLHENDLDAYEKQVRLEEEAYDAALERLKSINEARQDPLLMADRGSIRAYMSEWLPKLTALVEEEVNLCKKAQFKDRERGYYGPFLRLVPPEKLAIITISDTLRLHSQTMREHLTSSNGKVKGIKTSKLVSYIGNQVEMEYHHAELKKKKNSHLIARSINLQSMASNGKLFNMTVRKAQAKVERELVQTDWIKSWPPIVRVKIGSMLVSMLIQCAKFTHKHVDPETNETSEEEVPAFSHSHVAQKGKIYGVISIHDSLTKLFSTQPVKDTMNARWLPMLVPPRPWLSYNSGGYLTQNSVCMRTKEAQEQLRYLQRASDEDRLVTVLTGLDVLGMTKWAINRRVFETVIKVWNSGEALAEIPPANRDVVMPPKPEDYDTNKIARVRWGMEAKSAQDQAANNHSIRCDVNYKIEIAKAFLGKPMYFPHNLDFRGRAYPIPPHFNHLGNDLCRGLLLFHEARPLGERGLYWLKIHLANVYGYDKYSHSERIEFTERNLDMIFDSADNPLDGKRWWLNSENPWQTLATCIELAEALRSPEPHKHMSRLHVHQDGTCNGLQHYAALGCDRGGAKHVNLVPSDRPQDVYSAILHFVIKGIEMDVKNDVREAKLLQGRVTRKVIKQTVMTNVYGVTLIGAKEQIMNRLREIEGEDGKPVFDIIDLQPLSLYLAHKVFDSLGEVFTSARMIQDWLNESARRIAKSMPTKVLKDCMNATKSQRRLMKGRAKAADGNVLLPAMSEKAMKRRRQEFIEKLQKQPMSSVVWTTPLGLTVVQPYRKHHKRQIPTHLQSLSIYDHSIPSPVNAQKQKTAFPPNFVHSLDASHMILSAIECHRRGLVFASVHDSYWTHACDVDTMNEVLRDQFVALHRYPIMENLKKEFEERYKDYMMPVVDNGTAPSASSGNQAGNTSGNNKAVAGTKGEKGRATKLSARVTKQSLPDHLNAIFAEGNDEDTSIEGEDPVADACNPANASASKAAGGDQCSNQNMTPTISFMRVKWEPLTFPPLPKTGDFDINEVLQSPYFFS